MIEHILSHYGAKGIVETSESLRSTCPIHGGSNSSSFSISKSGGLYTCFACGASGNLVRLVIELEGCSKKEAVDRIKDFGATQYLYGQQDFLKEFDGFDSEEPEEINLDISKFSRKQAYFLKQGFSKSTLDYFNVCFCNKTTKSTLGMELKGRYIIPIYNERNKLVAVSGRVSWETKQRKYQIYPEKLPKRNLLYNLNNINSDRVLVTEGFKGVWRAHQAGVPAVAIMGCKVHDNQTDILISKFRNVVLALDMDIHGVEGMVNAAEKLSPFMKVRFIELPLEKDLGDVTEKEILDSEALDINLLKSRLELFKER